MWHSSEIVKCSLKYMHASSLQGLFPSVHGIVSDFMTRDGIAGAFDPRNHPQSPALKDPLWYSGKPVSFLPKHLRISLSIA